MDDISTATAAAIFHAAQIISFKSAPLSAATAAAGLHIDHKDDIVLIDVIVHCDCGRNISLGACNIVLIDAIVCCHGGGRAAHIVLALQVTSF